MPDAPPTITRIKVLPEFGALIAASKTEGFAFVGRTADEFASGANRFDKPGEAFFIAADTGRVVGICGLNVDPFAGDPAVGRVRHLYVLPACRRRGIARALLTVVVAAARGRFERLHLRTFNPAADALYRVAGFVPCTGVPRTTHILELGAA